MKILFITHKYPPKIGGMEKQSFELINGFSKLHYVIVHAYKGEGSKLLWFLRLKKEVKKILKEHSDINIIHLNDGLMGAACTWLQSYSDIPTLVTYHGLDITFPLPYFQNKIVPKLQKYTAGICVSNATATACKKAGFSREKIHVVLNGVDHDLADIKPDPDFLKYVKQKYNEDLSGKKIVMTMGRPVKRKGFSWFIENVSDHLPPDTIFLMVGPLNRNRSLPERLIDFLPKKKRHQLQLMLGIATDTEAVINAVNNPIYQGRVIHVGKVPFSDLMQFLGIADVFVMPNIKVEGDAEGFGLVALEASLRGAPVLASGIEGIVDAISHNGNGLLLPTENKEAWIEAIASLLNDEQRLADFSIQTKRYTKEYYSWEKMVSGYEEVFNSYS